MDNKINNELHMMFLLNFKTKELFKMFSRSKQNEIWEMIKEITIKFKETNKLLTEKFQLTDQKFKETDQKFKETDKLLTEKFQLTDKVLTVKFQQTDKRIKSLAKLFEDQWGKLMEALVEGGIIELFQKYGIDVNEIHQRVKKRKDGRHMEIDLLLENGSDVIIVEVKTTLRANHIVDFLERMSVFQQFFTKYKNYSVYGAVTALRVEQTADRYAEKNGLFVVKIGNDNLISLLNQDDFIPKKF